MKRKNMNVKLNNLSNEDEDSTTDNGSELEGEDMEESADNEDKAEQSGDSDALDASVTESDEDDAEYEDSSKNEIPKTKSEKVKEDILRRYQERQGKQLYIRFPHKVPETQEALEDKVRELTPFVVKVHKPRQRHARFCLIDFATRENRDTALKNIKKAIKMGKFEKYVVQVPRTESTEFVSELTERKIKSIENKKAKLRLKKASKKSLKEKKFTSTIIVQNLPKKASMLQLREIFSNAVDINIQQGKGKMNKDKSIAAITLPTTLDARNAIKKKLSLEGNQLFIRFDNQKLKKIRKLENNQQVKVSTITNKDDNKKFENRAKKPKLDSTSSKSKNFKNKKPVDAK